MEKQNSKKTDLAQDDSIRYFRYMAEFVGFTEQDAEKIRSTRYIIEKYIPDMVGGFYTHLLQYPATRKYFLAKDGTIDQEYLELRMYHQVNFWRRTADAVYDDDYAKFVDYVGKAHTSRGADPNIYIPERYVIAMVGYVQHAIGTAMQIELNEIDPQLAIEAGQAWNKLALVILEMLSSAYDNERQSEKYLESIEIKENEIYTLALESYERNLGIARSIEYRDIFVGLEVEIPDGDRKIIQVDDLSIGVFHHDGNWYAIKNRCLHRSGPVCEGPLIGDVIACPWHGYKYNLKTGKLLIDPDARLDTYKVEVRSGEVHVIVPLLILDEPGITLSDSASSIQDDHELGENEFLVSLLQPGQMKSLRIGTDPIVVYNVDGQFYATQDECTHAGGPLSTGDLDGQEIVCPLHFSCFDVTDGSVTCGPARKPLKTYQIIIDGDIGRVV